MPTLQSIVTTIIDDYAPEKGRPTVLAMVERAIKTLFNQNCALSTFYNRLDPVFPFPILKTVAGQLSYELTASNLVNSSGTAVTLAVNGVTVALRDLAGVFVKGRSARSGAYHPNFRGASFNLSGLNPYWGNQFYDSYYSVIGVPTPRCENQALTFTFLEDPGTESNQYYVEAFFEHPDLDTDTDPVLLNLDLWEQEIIDGAVGYIEDFDNGDGSGNRRLQKFEEMWKPKFSMYANKDIGHRNSMQVKMREMG